MEVGQIVDVHLEPSEAYGEVDPDAIFTVEIDKMPGAETLEAGQQVYLQNMYGQPFPMAMSALPFRAEETLTVSSGAEVPKATMVRPITMEGMRKRLAMDAAPSVSPLAPKRMRRRPPRRERISMRILFFVQI